MNPEPQSPKSSSTFNVERSTLNVEAGLRWPTPSELHAAMIEKGLVAITITNTPHGLYFTFRPIAPKEALVSFGSPYWTEVLRELGLAAPAAKSEISNPQSQIPGAPNAS